MCPSLASLAQTSSSIDNQNDLTPLVSLCLNRLKDSPDSILNRGITEKESLSSVLSHSVFISRSNKNLNNNHMPNEICSNRSLSTSSVTSDNNTSGEQENYVTRMQQDDSGTGSSAEDECTSLKKPTITKETLEIRRKRWWRTAQVKRYILYFMKILWNTNSLINIF